MLESKFQSDIIDELKKLLPGCYVMKQDTDYQQGIPDLLILWGDRWAMLEVKRKEPTSPRDWEPNQEWYLEEFNGMSFAACIYPENVEDVLNDLQHAFRLSRRTRVPVRQ